MRAPPAPDVVAVVVVDVVIVVVTVGVAAVEARVADTPVAAQVPPGPKSIALHFDGLAVHLAHCASAFL